jgi:hypothetical protein
MPSGRPRATGPCGPRLYRTPTHCAPSPTSTCKRAASPPPTRHRRVALQDGPPDPILSPTVTAIKGSVTVVPPSVPPLFACPIRREAPQRPPFRILFEHDRRRDASSPDFSRSTAAEAFFGEHHRKLESLHVCHVSPLPSTFSCCRTLPPSPSTTASACI